MKRSQRSAHRLIWLILTPLVAAVIILSVQLRPAEPVNNTLPSALTGGAD